MEDDALTKAAWAGSLSAQGNCVDAKQWEEAARVAAGRMICRSCNSGNGGAVEVRLIGEEPTSEDIQTLVEYLKIYSDGLERKEDRKKRMEAEKEQPRSEQGCQAGDAIPGGDGASVPPAALAGDPAETGKGE